MGQCVPNDDVSVFNYSVAELTWKDGELGIGPLESPVAVSHQHPSHLWINPSVSASATIPPTMDALVPDCSINMKRVSDDPIKHYSLEHKKKKKKSHKRITPPALHNQSQGNRRDKINQRMNTLQKLLPNSSKTDTASMLDKVIEHLKQLQSQIDMMSRMNISSMARNPMNMMLPLAMQQQQQLLQFQMSMLTPTPTPMAMGLSPLVLHPTAFMPADQAAAPSSDPLPPFPASHSQVPHPMNMEAYSRMVAMYQQLQQSYAPISKG